MYPVVKPTVAKFKNLLVTPATDERVVVYNGIAAVVIPQIIKSGIIDHKDGLEQAKQYIRNLAYKLNEITIVDRTLFEKIVLRHLMFRIDYLKPDEVYDKAYSIKSFMDVFKLEDYFAAGEIELVNAHLELFREVMLRTQDVINDILPDMD
jgi:hypothetical protein